MKNIDWHDLKFFLYVARSESLTGASQSLRVSPSTVARRIGALETAVGTPLFNRHSTGYFLTDAGREILAQTGVIEDSVLALERTLAGRDDQLRGTVRLATSEALANGLVAPHLGRFRARHPGIRLELVAGIRSVNLTRREADVALRIQRPEQSNLVTRRVGQLRWSLYASADFAAARGLTYDSPALFQNPELVDWVDEYQFLTVAEFQRRTFRGVQPVMSVNNLSLQIRALHAGVGMAFVPVFMAERKPWPNLLRLLPLEKGFDRDLWLIVHPELRYSARVRAVMDFVAEIANVEGPHLTGVEIGSPDSTPTSSALCDEQEIPNDPKAAG